MTNMKKQLTLNVNGQHYEVEVGEGETMKSMRAKWGKTHAGRAE